MHPLVKNKKIRQYCCSNPNCNASFSKPKIIKFYVCPLCQTVVELDPNNFHPLILEKSDIEQQVRKKKVQPNKNEDDGGLIPSKPATIRDESISSKKPEVRENLETRRLTKAEEFNIVDEYFRIGKSQNGIEEHEFSPKTTKAEEFNIIDDYFGIGKSQNGIEEHEFSPKTHCQYFFGYLRTKNKEEAVPETCFGCLKSIECMLKEYNSP